MKGASKVIMGATLVTVVSLGVVLGLVLVLLAELYCTLLLRRRQLRITSSNLTTATIISASPIANTSSSQPPQPLNEPASPCSYYAPGVLQAPRSLFFPAVSDKETKNQLHHILDVHTQESNTGLVKTSPCKIQEIPIQISTSNCVGGGGESFLYISNPIYDNDASRAETPFETPESSPSRLETGGSSSYSSSSSSSCEEEIVQPSPSSPHSLPLTPPLTPMKKLPAEACSVSLRDARSLGSDSVSNNGVSSSSSGSPCTSPSW